MRDSLTEYKEYLTRAVLFLDSYRILPDSYIAEYFTDSIIERLPKTWRQQIPFIEIDEISSRILEDNSNGQTVNSVWPLSLLAYIATCHALTLKGKHSTSDTQWKDSWKDINIIVSQTAVEHHLDLKNKGKAAMLLPHNFRRHVKPKKQYEIDVVAKIANVVAKTKGAQNIVDVGAGLGHLSRLLAYGYDYHVSSIEAKEHFNATAEQFDSEVNQDHIRQGKQVSGNQSDSGTTRSSGSIVHKDIWIDLDISSTAFMNLISSSKSDDPHSREKPHVEDSSIVHTSLEEILQRRTFEREFPTTQTSFSRNDHGNSGSFEKPGCPTSERNPQSTDSKMITINKTDSDGIVLVGLHTCGDLASTLVRVFNQCDCVQGMVLIGCCYMKLTYQEISRCDCHLKTGLPTFDIPHTNCTDCAKESTRDSTCSTPHDTNTGCGCSDNIDAEDMNLKQYGFPLSSHLCGMNVQPLGYNAFELGCHFLEQYKSKVRDASPSLKLHCYRATLEVLIRKLNPEMKLPPVRCKKIKNSQGLMFEEYAIHALKRICLEHELPLTKYIDYDSMLKKWKDVVVFYCLRLLLGPVIESVVLVDRLLFLSEKGYDVKLVPIFDPEVSPRNFALIVMK